MDGTASSAAGGSGKRGSFLPRPGMTSKLPTPGAVGGGGSSSSGNGAAVATNGSTLRSPTMTPSGGFGIQRSETVRSTNIKPTHVQRPLSSTTNTTTATVPRTKSGSLSGISHGHRPTPSLNKGTNTPLTKQPLAPTQARSGQQHQRQTSVASTSSSHSRLTRQNSLQSDSAPDGHSSEESEPVASTPTSPVSDASSLKLPKKSRPSLSDRTIETLANVPPSPVGSERRRSGFFSPPGSMTPQRPSSVIGSPVTASKVNYGTAKRENGFARPTSPSKNRPPSTFTPGPAPRRSLSTSIAKPSGTTTSARVPSPTKNRRISSAMPAKTNTPRPGSRIGTFPTKPTPQRPVQQKSASTVPPTTEREQEPGPSNNKRPAPSATSTASSSSTLRQQIAEAKAKARNTQSRQPTTEDAEPSSYDFENCEDPFNTKPKDGKDLLRKRVDDARRDGRLNIAAMSLSEVPNEVLSMYDAESMENSSVSWSETVDLVRFNAADNEISELDEKVFPDVSAADLEDAEDSKGNQFGGLEHLDLHGNKLTSVPLGFRQLTRLTSLNLSRNKLDDALFDIITRIPTLCELNLSNNQLAHELPDSVGRLSLLETLDLSNNRITTLPRSLRDLTRLRSLSLSHNRLQSLPFDSLSQTKTLRELSASHNAFSGALFPSSVTHMPHLRILDVSDNAVASLNFSKVLKLPALIRMDVSRNRLGMFPDISEWVSLTTLLADENALSDLPRGMLELREKLKTVSLDRNSIRDVDEAVADMEALETLSLAGNPLRERKLLNMETHDIKREMMRRRDLAREVDGS